MSHGDLVIRDFDPDRDADWEVWVAISNAVFPEYRMTVAEMRRHDANRDPRCIRVRRFAERNGIPVGTYGYGQIPWVFHPDRYGADVAVLPERRRRGVGSALYDHLVAEATERGAEAFLGKVREDEPDALAFAEKRGFIESMREWESRLDVTTFDPGPWAEARSRPEQHGIAIRSLAELASDPERDQKVWELENLTGADVPSTEPYTPLPFESYQKLVLTNPSMIPDAFIVAVETATGKYVGTSNLWKREADADLQTGLTGVLRDYRRMGIALAMKLRVIDYARSVGAPTIRTENATTNRPMLSINEALGYVKQPVWILLTREFGTKRA